MIEGPWPLRRLTAVPFEPINGKQQILAPTGWPKKYAWWCHLRMEVHGKI